MEGQLRDSNWPSVPSAYSLDVVIGSGAYGLVWAAQCKQGTHTNVRIAIKILDLEQFKSSSIQLIRKEISIMSMSKHKNIVEEYISFVDFNYLWIVMPLIDAGSVVDVMRQVRPSNQPGIQDEAIIATIMKETLEGLLYLHSNRQMHRDIKAGNILLDRDGHVYLCDYGVSATLKKGYKRASLVGTPKWMAPEVCSQEGHDERADIWSLGITAIELAHGHPPHNNLQPLQVIKRIVECEPPQLQGEKWSKEFKDFVACMLVKEPCNRLTVKMLLETQVFLQKAKPDLYVRQAFLDKLPDKALQDQVLQSRGDEFKQKSKQHHRKPCGGLQWDFKNAGCNVEIMNVGESTEVDEQELLDKSTQACPVQRVDPRPFVDTTKHDPCVPIQQENSPSLKRFAKSNASLCINKSFIHKRINGMTPVPTQKQLREDSDDDMFMQLNEDNNVGAGDRS